MSYFKVINGETEETICVGYGNYSYAELNGISLESTPFVSTDGVYFFNVTGCDKYFTSLVDDKTTNLMEFNIDACEGIDIISPNEFSEDHYNAIIKRTVESEEEDSSNVIIMSTGWKEVCIRATGEVIARGRIVSSKSEHGSTKTKIPSDDNVHERPILNECSLFSFDYKHYFWTNGNSKYEVKDTKIRVPVEYVERKDFVQRLWREEFEQIRNADVIREYSINECDPEIQGLVYALNKIPGIETIVSCSGHDTSYAWVSMKATDKGLVTIFNILRDYTAPYFDRFWINPTSHTVNPKNTNMIERNGPTKDSVTYFALFTYDKGQPAYDALDALAKSINEQFGGPKND